LGDVGNEARCFTPAVRHLIGGCYRFWICLAKYSLTRKTQEMCCFYVAGSEGKEALFSALAL